MYDQSTGGYVIIEDPADLPVYQGPIYEDVPQTFFEAELPPTLFFDESTGGYIVVNDYQ